ncbi:unnamed protein product, partial [marine sediment metagenome]
MQTPWMGQSLKGFLSKTIIYIIIIVMAIGFMLPYGFALTSSLKSHAEIHLFPPRLLPSKPLWDNYLEVFRQVTFARFIGNSVIVVILAGVGQVVTSAMVAY